MDGWSKFYIIYSMQHIDRQNFLGLSYGDVLSGLACVYMPKYLFWLLNNEKTLNNLE